MPRGGARPGAGRKSGEDWKEKRPVRVRKMARETLKRVLEGKKDPVSILLDIASNEEVDVSPRVQAASHAAPYCFPRLSMSVIADASQSLKSIDPQRLVAELNDRISRLSPPRQATIDATGEAV